MAFDLSETFDKGLLNNISCTSLSKQSNGLPIIWLTNNPARCLEIISPNIVIAGSIQIVSIRALTLLNKISILTLVKNISIMCALISEYLDGKARLRQQELQTIGSYGDFFPPESRENKHPLFLSLIRRNLEKSLLK